MALPTATRLILIARTNSTFGAIRILTWLSAGAADTPAWVLTLLGWSCRTSSTKLSPDGETSSVPARPRPWAGGLEVFNELGLDAIAAYDFTKEAVVLYSMLVSSQERHRGVRVNAVSPGAVQTPILKDFYATMGSELLDQLRRQAGGRDAKPEEIANAIALLLDARFFWMNGVDVVLDGGAEAALTFGEMATPARSVPG